MSDLKERTSTTSTETRAAPAVDLKLEIVVIPVSDVERAKQFYARLGWRLDADYASGDDYRVIQFTPPGSDASVIFGKNVTAAAPGSAQGLYLVVSDIEAARKELLGRGVAISEAFHGADGVFAGPDEPYLFGRIRVGGADPEHRTYRSFRLVQRSRRQRLAAAGSHRATARTRGRRQHDVRLHDRPRRRVPPRSRRPRRTREAERWPARCELAGLVRRVHRQGTGRRTAAVVRCDIATRPDAKLVCQSRAGTCRSLKSEPRSST